MTEREALLRAVCENPDDDTPRLVFADWLQEHGDESDRARAEFIRLQCRLHRVEASPWEPDDADEWATTLARVERLHEAHSMAWVHALCRRSGLERPNVTWGGFERGFVGSVSVGRCPDWDRVFWATPLTELSLMHADEPGVPLRHPAAARLTHLRLYTCELSAADWDLLATPDRLPRLRALFLRPFGYHLDPSIERRMRDRFGDGFELNIPQSYYGE